MYAGLLLASFGLAALTRNETRECAISCPFSLNPLLFTPLLKSPLRGLLFGTACVSREQEKESKRVREQERAPEKNQSWNLTALIVLDDWI